MIYRIYEKIDISNISSHIITHRHASLPSNRAFGAIIDLVANEFKVNLKGDKNDDYNI